MSGQQPTPQERLETAIQHATLLRALFKHPQTVIDQNQRARSDRSRMPLTLWNALDFHYSTFTKYILPLLPPDAVQHCRALSNIWDSAPADFIERPELMADDLFPRMHVGGLQEKWSDAIGRGVMISAIIMDDGGKQVLFGGKFDFGREVEEATRALAS